MTGNGHRRRQLRRTLLVPFVALLASGCAGATLRSGVGDTYFDRAPYYAGAPVVSTGVIAHLPVSYQRGATQPHSFDPSGADEKPVARLIGELNGWLDELGATVRIDARPSGTAPDVRFGCERLPDDDCEDADQRRPHRLAVGRPSRSWVEWAAAEAAAAGADRILVLTLEIGNYLPRQRDWRGSKEIQLGTGYTVDLPWLTATDKPVSVLQLTGVLVDTEGKAIRAGAEGLLARRTSIILAGFGAQALITDEDVQRALTQTRDDLPGRPLVWKAALANLVAQLTGTPDVAVH